MHTQQMTVVHLFRGGQRLSQPPIDDIETYWSPMEKSQTRHMLAYSIIGGPETVRAGLQSFIAETQADELIIVSDMFEHAKRLRSLEIIAELAGTIA
jgi:alkanesulfonate monooxygenase SsuD/methylene tetrahydromethanopterin reductase-like flavin-dependent oxidoreductase (luciferase family)